MKALRDEEILYQTENKRFTLTNFRLREEGETYFGKNIKSIMLEEITACEMRSIKNPKYAKWAAGVFVFLNGFVYLFNHFLTTAEISKFFFGPNKIPASAALSVFYISIILSFVLLWLFAISIKQVASFYAPGVEIDIYQKWLENDVRGIMISKVEQAKKDRLLSLNE